MNPRNQKRVKLLACITEWSVVSPPKILSVAFLPSRGLELAAPVVRKIPLADGPDVEEGEIRCNAAMRQTRRLSLAKGLRPFVRQ